MLCVNLRPQPVIFSFTSPQHPSPRHQVPLGRVSHRAKPRAREIHPVRALGFGWLVRDWIVRDWIVSRTANSNTTRISNPGIELIVQKTEGISGVYQEDIQRSQPQDHILSGVRPLDEFPQDLDCSSTEIGSHQACASDSLVMSQSKRDNRLCSRGNCNNQLTSQGYIDEFLARKKRQTIDEFMDMVLGWLDTNPAFTSHTPGMSGGSARSESHRSSSSNSSSGGIGQGSGRAAGQKRGLQSDGAGDNGDDNEEENRGSKRSKVAKSNRPKPRLACPFFKRDPSKHNQKQACTGPGWTEISRLKEHIYRCHTQGGFICPRCRETFSDAEHLETHQRADKPCKVSKSKHPEGINNAQYNQLRKKTLASKSISERWVDIYRIVFPDATGIPSPYYDYDEGRETDSETPGLTAFMREALPSCVRNVLEDRYEQFNEKTKGELVDIVRAAIGETFQQYKQQYQQPQPATASSTPPSDEATKVEVPIPIPIPIPAVAGTALPLGNWVDDHPLIDFGFESFATFGNPAESNNWAGFGAESECPAQSDSSENDSAYWSAGSPSRYK